MIHVDSCASLLVGLESMMVRMLLFVVAAIYSTGTIPQCCLPLFLVAVIGDTILWHSILLVAVARLALFLAVQ